MDRWQIIFLFIGGMGLAAIVSYFLALIGEPQNSWIWKDLLGIL